MTRFAKWDRASVLVVASMIVLKACVHLLSIRQYGFHGDELYFLAGGLQPAFGYVDHPPLIPWIAAATQWFGGGIIPLRLPAIAAGVGTMLLTAMLIRDWGGGWLAQLIGLSCLLLAPAHLRMGAMLNIPVIEVFLCTLTAFLVSRASMRGSRGLWLGAGAALGLAILAKHSSLLWGATLAFGMLVAGPRAMLRQRWPWLAVALAAAIATPNFIWLAQNDFATLEFMRNLSGELLDQQGRLLFVLGQLLYFHPLAAPVWLVGAAVGIRKIDRHQRPFALQFLAMFAFLLVSGGKPYYLASAYPAVLAIGAIAFAGWFKNRHVLGGIFVTTLATSGMGFVLLSLPILPLRDVDQALERMLGRIVPPIALTHDMHGMHGWPEQVLAIDHVFQSLPPADQQQATVLVRSYAQAANINLFGKPGTPRALSGHMNYFLWGPGNATGEVLITFGFPTGNIEQHYATCVERGRIIVPLARPHESNMPVFVCRGPKQSLASLWPTLKWYGHRDD